MPIHRLGATIMNFYNDGDDILMLLDTTNFL